MANDSDPVGLGLTITITTDPKNGTAVLNEDGTITYTLINSTNGNDTLTYTICDKGSPSKCATAKVIISIFPTLPAIEIYNLVTPNGDGQNDFWHIDGIEGFPENEIIIFNRWGDKVKEFMGYNNISNRWDGSNEKNEFLPDGVYFYIIKLNDESITPNTYTGWVYVRGKGGN
jgi:gliding motility-associated-like protein